MKRILSIGGGGAGMMSLITAAQLKKDTFEIISLSDEEDIYCRCTTPYIFSGESSLEAAVEPDSLMTQYGLKIVREKAVKLDVVKKQILTDKGNTHAYDYLVIATGAAPFVPDLPGLDLPQVCTVRTSRDAKEICDSLESNAKTAVIVGAGVIGLEMAGAFRSQGLDVTVIERNPGLSPNIFDNQCSQRLIKHLEDGGIKFNFDTELKEVTKSSPDGMVKEVSIVRSGVAETLSADIIILAIGVRANLDIIKDTPIKATPRGILVDNRMRTNIKDVYACGDCCVPLYAPTREYIPSQLASTAVQQAKIVGFQIAGYPIKYNGSTGAFAFEILDKQYAAVGMNEAMARKKFRWVVVGRAETTDIYRDMKEVQPLQIKLIFAGPRMRLVGYEAFGRGVITSAGIASFAIGLRLGPLSMLKYNYISHPSMTPWPFMNPIIMATEDAIGTMVKNVKGFFGK